MAVNQDLYLYTTDMCVGCMQVKQWLASRPALQARVKELNANEQAPLAALGQLGARGVPVLAWHDGKTVQHVVGMKAVLEALQRL